MLLSFAITNTILLKLMGVYHFLLGTFKNNNHGFMSFITSVYILNQYSGH
jgi:hypothetical protein